MTAGYTGPKAKIVGEGKTAVFKPTALTVAEDTSGNDCLPIVAEAKITNKGTATAYVTFEGSPIFLVPSKQSEFVCSYGYGAGAKLVLGLSNKKDTKTYSSTLTLTTSD